MTGSGLIREGSTREQRRAYLLLRLLTGLDFFGHGFARIATGTHLSGFAHGMVKSMAESPLPATLTLATGYAVPCVELVIGRFCWPDCGFGQR